MVSLMMATRLDGKDMTSRILIVDDVPQVRTELRTLLHLAGDIEIVGEASNGLDAIRQAQALKPNVVLMDLEMPLMNGYEATQKIKDHLPYCKVIALTIHSDADAQARAFESGVDVFIVKGSRIEDLVQEIIT
jgi:DNA-binding NarL/FixJ family response regulator